MKILFYTDCMSNDDWTEDNAKYPSLIKAELTGCEIKSIVLDGMTTWEASEKFNEAINEKPEIVVFGFGVNDALPRGLSRNQRASIIRWTYKVRMTKLMRRWFRTLILNPFEYIMQIIANPKHYFTIEETLANIDKCVEAFTKSCIRVIIINIAPVKNYRFRDANFYIKKYNTAINEYCLKKDIKYVDAFNLFHKLGLKNALGRDKFHYSKEAHSLVAKEIIKLINTI